jgi:putative nucleotidyltransferase with HDIG domain
MSPNIAHDDLVVLLCTGISQRRLYFDGHPKIREITEDVTRALHRLLGESGRDSFFLGVVNRELVRDGRILVGPTIVGRHLIEFAEQLRSGGFLFDRGVDSREIGEFLSLATERLESFGSLEEANEELARRGVTSIKLSPEYDDPAWFGQLFFDGTEEWADGKALADSISVHQTLYETVRASHQRAGQGRALDLDGARSTTERLLNVTQGRFMDIMQLVHYPDYDSYTVGHSLRVAMILLLVCHRLGVERHRLVEIGTAGLLHDVGKGRIPQEILYKRDALAPDERRTMERHTILGAQILLESGSQSPLAVSAAWGHHLRYDGGGYPAPPPWGATTWVTRVLHACDVFEALTAVRPYKEVISPRRAYEMMIGDRGAFEPAALAALVSAMGLYPPGTHVLLSNGRRAVVLAAGKRLDRPHVRLTHDASGAPIPIADAPAIDLDSSDASAITISAAADHLLVVEPAAKAA